MTERIHINKSYKLHTVLNLFRSHKLGLSLTELVKTLKCSERTVLRYIAELKKWGYAINGKASEEGQSLVYSLLSETDDTGENHSDFLEQLKQELHKGGNPKYAKQLNEVIRFLKKGKEESAENSNPADLYYIDHGPFAESEPQSGILRIVEGAIAQCRVIKIRYRNTEKGSDELTFFPYGLALRIGVLYLLGRQDSNTDSFKTLSVRRIIRCTATTQSFSRTAYNPQEVYRYCIGQWAKNPDDRVEIIVLEMKKNSWVQRHLTEAHFNPPAKLYEKAGRSFCELQLVVKPDLLNWIQSLMPELWPISPISIRQELHRRLNAGLSLVTENSRKADAD